MGDKDSESGSAWASADEIASHSAAVFAAGRTLAGETTLAAYVKALKFYLRDEYKEEDAVFYRRVMGSYKMLTREGNETAPSWYSPHLKENTDFDFRYEVVHNVAPGRDGARILVLPGAARLPPADPREEAHYLFDREGKLNVIPGDLETIRAAASRKGFVPAAWSYGAIQEALRKSPTYNGILLAGRMHVLIFNEADAGNVFEVPDALLRKRPEAYLTSGALPWLDSGMEITHQLSETLYYYSHSRAATAERVENIGTIAQLLYPANGDFFHGDSSRLGHFKLVSFRQLQMSADAQSGYNERVYTLPENVAMPVFRLWEVRQVFGRQGPRELEARLARFREIEADNAFDGIMVIGLAVDKKRDVHYHLFATPHGGYFDPDNPDRGVLKLFVKPEKGEARVCILTLEDSDLADKDEDVSNSVRLMLATAQKKSEASFKRIRAKFKDKLLLYDEKTNFLNFLMTRLATRFEGGQVPPAVEVRAREWEADVRNATAGDVAAIRECATNVYAKDVLTKTDMISVLAECERSLTAGIDRLDQFANIFMTEVLAEGKKTPRRGAGAVRTALGYLGFPVGSGVDDAMEYVRLQWSSLTASSALASHYSKWQAIEKWFVSLADLEARIPRWASLAILATSFIDPTEGLGEAAVSYFEGGRLIMRNGLLLMHFASGIGSVAMTGMNLFRLSIQGALESEYGSDTSRALVEQDKYATWGRLFALLSIGFTVGFTTSGRMHMMNLFYALAGTASFALKTAFVSWSLHMSGWAADWATTRLVHAATGSPEAPLVMRTRRLDELVPWFDALRARSRIIPNGSDLLQAAMFQIGIRDIRWSSPLDMPVRKMTQWFSYFAAVQMMGRVAGVTEGAAFEVMDSTTFGMPMREGLLGTGSLEDVERAAENRWQTVQKDGGVQEVLRSMKLGVWGEKLDEYLGTTMFGGLPRPGWVIDQAYLGAWMGMEAANQLGAEQLASDRLQMAVFLHQVRAWRNSGNFAYGNPIAFGMTMGSNISGAFTASDPVQRAKYATTVAWDMLATILSFYNITDEFYKLALKADVGIQSIQSVGDFLTNLAVSAGASPDAVTNLLRAGGTFAKGIVGAFEGIVQGTLNGGMMLGVASGAVNPQTMKAWDQAQLPAHVAPPTGRAAIGQTEGHGTAFLEIAAPASQDAMSGEAARGYRSSRIAIAEEERKAMGDDATTQALVDADARNGGMQAVAVVGRGMAQVELVPGYVERGLWVPDADVHRGAYGLQQQLQLPLAEQLFRWYETFEEMFANAGLEPPPLTPTTMRAVMDDYVRAGKLYGSPTADSAAQAILSKFYEKVGDKKILSILAGNKQALSVFTTMLRVQNPVFNTLQIDQEGQLRGIIERGYIASQKLDEMLKPYPREEVFKEIGKQFAGWGAMAEKELAILTEKGIPATGPAALREAEKARDLQQTVRSVATTQRLASEKPEYIRELMAIVDRVSVAAYDPLTIGTAVNKVIDTAFAEESAGRGFGALTTAQAKNLAGLVSWGRAGAFKDAVIFEDFVARYGTKIVTHYATPKYTRTVAGTPDEIDAWARLEALAGDFKLDDVAAEIQALYAGDRDALSEESAYLLGALAHASGSPETVFAGVDVSESRKQILGLTTRFAALGNRVVQKHLEYLAARGAELVMPFGDGVQAADALAYGLGFNDPLEVYAFNLDKKFGVRYEDRLDATRVIIAVRADAEFAVRARRFMTTSEAGNAAVSNAAGGMWSWAIAQQRVSDVYASAIPDGFVPLLQKIADIGGAYTAATTAHAVGYKAIGTLTALTGKTLGGAAGSAAFVGLSAGTVATGGGLIIAAGAAMWAFWGGGDATGDAPALAKAVIDYDISRYVTGSVFDPNNVFYAAGNVSAAVAPLGQALEQAITGTRKWQFDIPAVSAEVSQGASAARQRRGGIRRDEAGRQARLARKAEREDERKAQRRAEMARVFEADSQGVLSLDSFLARDNANVHPRLKTLVRQMFRPTDLVEDDETREQLEDDPLFRQKKKMEIAADVARVTKSYPTEMLLAQDYHHPYMVFLMTATLGLSWDSPKHRKKIPLELQMYMQRYDSRNRVMRGPHAPQVGEWSMASSTPVTPLQSALHRTRVFGFTRNGAMAFNPDDLVCVRTGAFLNPFDAPGKRMLIGGYILVDNTNLAAVAELQRVFMKAALDQAAYTRHLKQESGGAASETDRDQTVRSLAQEYAKAFDGPDGPATRAAVEKQFGDVAGPFSQMLAPEYQKVFIDELARAAPVTVGAPRGTAPPDEAHKSLFKAPPLPPRGSGRAISAGERESLYYNIDATTGVPYNPRGDEPALVEVVFHWREADRAMRQRGSWVILFISQKAGLPLVVPEGAASAIPADVLIARVLMQAAVDIRHGFIPPDRRERIGAAHIRVDLSDDPEEPFYENVDDAGLVQSIGANLSPDLFELAKFTTTVHTNVWSFDSVL